MSPIVRKLLLVRMNAIMSKGISADRMADSFYAVFWHLRNAEFLLMKAMKLLRQSFHR